MTVWSYCDRMYCALLACHEQIPDPHTITAGLHDELRTLLDAAAQRPAAITGCQARAS